MYNLVTRTFWWAQNGEGSGREEFSQLSLFQKRAMHRKT
jgi:hypothetical protein